MGQHTYIRESLIGLFLLCGASVNLYFPPNSDVGYIIPDEDSESTIQDDSFLQEVGEPLNLDIKEQVRRELWQRDGVLGKQENLQFPDERATAEMEFSLADLPDELKDDKHGVAMGISNDKCDNAEVNLEVDWDFSPINYTCYRQKSYLPVLSDLPYLEHCDNISADYTPPHFCMNRPITYDDPIPTYGAHRPLWPVFGEYKFVPAQRWLHNIEHGAVVMLYDPCAEPVLVNKLRKLVTGCLYKHIITSYNFLSKERPLALVAWGCRVEMATVDSDAVKTFIRKRALHGPEGNYIKQGSYNKGLLVMSHPPAGSDIRDSVLCPE